MDYVIVIDSLLLSLLTTNYVPCCNSDNSILFCHHSITLKTLGNGCFGQ
jgi:hypothetical protein